MPIHPSVKKAFLCNDLGWNDFYHCDVTPHPLACSQRDHSITLNQIHRAPLAMKEICILFWNVVVNS